MLPSGFTVLVLAALAAQAAGHGGAETADANLVRITRVNPGAHSFSLVNAGYMYQYLSDYWVCSHGDCMRLSGFLAPEVTADLSWDLLTEDSDELALYRGIKLPRNFADKEFLRDYVAWRKPGGLRSSVAVTAGKWDVGAHIDAALPPPYLFVGDPDDGDDRGVGSWTSEGLIEEDEALVRISAVDLDAGTFTLKNTDATRIQALEVLFFYNGEKRGPLAEGFLYPGAERTLPWKNLAAMGRIGVYIDISVFTQLSHPDKIVDMVQWSTGHGSGNPTSVAAAGAQIWKAGSTLPAASGTYRFVGTPADHGAKFWART